MAITGILTLAAALASFYASQQSNERLGQLSAVITDTDQLRDALRKPLEGVWDYSMRYDRFHEADGNFEAFGKAVFIWRPSLSKYQIFIGASLIDENADTGQIVTWLLETDLAANRNGWPEEPFTLVCDYRGRTASNPDWQSPQQAVARFTNITITKTNPDAGDATELKGEFHAPLTDGLLTLQRDD